MKGAKHINLEHLKLRILGFFQNFFIMGEPWPLYNHPGSVPVYEGSVGWPAPTFMSVDWSPCPWRDVGGNLRVAVVDALRAYASTSHRSLFIISREIFFYGMKEGQRR